jgi:pilus assembly protein Flp/PilA
MNTIRRFLGDDSGATAIEYALIGSMIAIVIVSAVRLVGTQTSAAFARVGNAFP